MDADVFALKFEVRYAVRVLERQARFFRRVELLSRGVSLFSGTAAFAAIVNGNAGATLAIGLVLAAAQVVDFVICPTDRKAEAHAASRPYALLQARLHRISTAKARNELELIKADDTVLPVESLRLAAHNDVILELGVEHKHIEPLTFGQRVVATLG